MEFKFTITPNQPLIQLIDQLMESYMALYSIPFATEICFVTHELVINAVEAMEKEGRTESIEVRMQNDEQYVQITVSDFAKGIPEEQWPVVLDATIDDESFCERGRGFLFIQHMVDLLWFEQLSDQQFLVGVKKNLVMAVEK